MLDKTSILREEKSKPAKTKLNDINYHIGFWVFFILYEITLAAAIRERFNHPADYILHYSLNILLFYFHCHVVLGTKTFDKIRDFKEGLALLVLEIFCYYILSVWLNNILVKAGIPVNVPDSTSRLFKLSIIYRFIYMIGIASTLRVFLNLIENRERIHQYLTQNLTIEKEKANLKAELVTAKLSFLRSQVNPHFLFNSLNSVYNRIRKNDPKSAEYVMALADLMQYALQPQTAIDEVAVDSELDHISNYLKLQGMRYSAVIDLTMTSEDAELKIAPLLLINIVENVFQHGELNNPKCRPLIEIIVKDGELSLTTKNEIRRDHRAGNGVGLTNTLKRLEYQYKGRFQFNYGAEGNIFDVKLLIKLK